MMKTVADLITELQKLDPSLIVAMSSDSEGNNIEDWSGGISFAFFNEREYPGDQFSGFIYDDDDNEFEVTEETATAVIIWP